MMITTLLTALALASPFAQAEDDKSVDQAYELCNTIPFDSQKEACQAAVNKASYFNPHLLKACAGPHDEKAKCLALIGDKDANAVAVKGCEDNHFWSSLEPCLLKIMKPHVAATAPAPAAPAADDKTCKKAKVSELIDQAVSRCKKLQYLDLYDSLVQLRAQLTLCGFD